MQRKKILWLVSWYPNKNDRFDGDFIQRHARAAAIDNDVHVIFVTGAETAKAIEEEWNYATGLTEHIIYFKKKSGFLNKFRKQLVWRKLYQKAIEKYISRNGLPECVHVHVPWKAGLIALWMKRKYGSPFIVTEHWGIYNDIVENNFQSRTRIFKFLLKKIYHEAKAFVMVSHFLAYEAEKSVGKECNVIIRNVVDTSLFFLKNEKYQRFTFLHVSNMVPLKNVKGILEAFKEILEKKPDMKIQLMLIGNRDNEYVKLAQEMKLWNRSVFFKGEILYAEVAKEMQRSHCFVLNSMIENSPCVIGEALCCGLPVIATGVGGVPELVNGTNGILIRPDKKNELMNAMLQVLENYQSFDAKQIADESAKKYNYSTISNQFDFLYKSVC